VNRGEPFAHFSAPHSVGTRERDAPLPPDVGRWPSNRREIWEAGAAV